MKKLAVALIVLVMCLSMVFAVACGPSVVELDILNEWEGNEVEDVYDISLANGVMTVPYVKGDTYEYMKRAFINETADSLKAVKTLVIEGKLESDYTPLNVILKFEYQQGYDPEEVNFQMSATSRIYEWDVSELNLDHATRMLIFAQGGKVTSGTLTISKLVLTSNPINEENNVTKFPVQTGGNPDTTHEVKTITATDTAIDAGWYDISDGVYTIAKEGTAYKVDFKKNGNQWPGMAAYITGEAISTMKSLVVTLKGTEGTRIMLKPLDDNSLEKIVTLTGGDDEFKVSLGDKAASADTSAEMKIIIIAEPGDTTKVGSFTIKSAALSTEAVVDDGPKETVNEIKEGSLSFNGGWYNLGGSDYTVTAVEGGWKVDYEKSDTYTFLKATVKGDAELFKTFKTVKLVVNGAAGQEILVKPFDNGKLETTVALTGEDVEVVIDLSKADAIDYTKLMLICAAPGNDAAKGSFVIKSAEFSAEGEEPAPAPAPAPVEDWGVLDLSSFDGWGKYTVDKTNGIRISHEAKIDMYGCCGADIATASLTERVKVTLKNNAETISYVKVCIKNDNDEKAAIVSATINGEAVGYVEYGALVELAGGAEAEVILVLDLTKAPDKFVISMNSEGGDDAAKMPAAGDVTITGAYVERVVNRITSAKLSFNAAWYDLGDKVYTVTATEKGWKVDYSNKGEWSMIYATVDIKEAVRASLESVKVVVKGTKDTEILVKAFDNWQLEKRVALTGGEDEIVIDLSKADSIDYTKRMLICIAPEVANASGSFEIISATFVSSAPVVNEIAGNNVGVNAGWYDSGDGDYEIVKEESGAYTVVVTKSAGHEWSTFKALVGGDDLSKIKTLVVTVKGEKDAQIMIKPFNRLEKWVTLSGGTDVIFVDLNVDNINFAEPIYIFGLPGKAEGTTTFQIIEAHFSYEVTNVIGDQVLSFNGAWYDLGDKVYTVAAADKGWKVDYSNKGEYSMLKANVSIDPAVQSAAKAVKVVVKGKAGDEILVKAFDNWQLEEKVVLTGGEDEIIIDLSKADSIDFTKLMLICAAPGTAGATGSFEIISAELVVEAPAAE